MRKTNMKEMKQIGKRWDKIFRGSKVIVKKDYSYTGFQGVPRVLKAGTYYINGFWADACGLRTTAKDGLNEQVIPSASLQFFYEVSK